jgi:cytochrome P450
MTSIESLDRSRIRELFDLRSGNHSFTGGGYEMDPYPAFHLLRQTGPVHPGVVHSLIGWKEDAYFQGLPHSDRPHFSVFGYEACDQAFRDNETFASSPGPIDIDEVGIDNSLIAMGGSEHRRYRSLVQPSFVPAKASWWIENWIQITVNALIDELENDGRAELNIDFCAAIPVLTITGSFGIGVAQALELRESLRPEEGGSLATFIAMLAPIVAARRDKPQDDLISVLVQAEFADERGKKHHLSDNEIYSFSNLLLSAGSGTTWKQMGIVLMALLLNPALLDAATTDRSVLRAAIGESLRWTPTDPVFARYLSKDVDNYFGCDLPKGAVLHMCIGAANRDPTRWENPDQFDPFRPVKPALGFGGGSHICLGMHVARAEMFAGIGALLDRLPNLRLDPEAEPPRMIGIYERGPTEIQVRFG